MQTTSTLTYCIVYNKFTYSNHIERAQGDEHLSAQQVGAEIAAQLDDIMLSHREASGEITVTIEIG
jgi:hypothetical protein